MSSSPEPFRRAGVLRAAPAAAAVAAAAVVPVVLGESQLAALTATVAIAVALLSLNVLVGYAGQISLGQAAFVGTGAFAAVQLGGRGLPLAVQLLGAGGVVALLTAVVGLPSLRIRGLAVAIATLVYGIAAQLYLFESGWFTGADRGLSLAPLLGHGPVYRMYLVALTVLVVVWLVDRQLLASKLGRAFLAVRDAHDRAVAFGVETGPAKLRAYGLSGFIAGMAGVLIVNLSGVVQGADFGVIPSLQLLALTVVGGAGSRVGVVAAAVLLDGLPRLVPPPDERLAPLAGGLVLVLVILFLPTGLGGLLHRLRPRVRAWLVTAGGAAVAVAVVVANSGRVAEATVTGTPWSAWWLPAAFGAVIALVAAVWLRERRAQGDAGESPAAASDAAVAMTRGGASARALRDVPRGLSLRVPVPVLFEARDVSVRFGGVQALGGVSIEVREGEIVGLIGANGAGKSTFFNVVSGFVAPEPGSVLRYRGRDLLTARPSARTEIGLARTFQHMGLLRPETVEDNVLLAQHWLAGYDAYAGVLRLGGSAATERELRRRAAAALEIFGLQDLRGERLGALPYGTMRMVELAAAVATGAELLFFDEASAGLGPSEAHDLGDRFQALREDLGLTLVVIEHHVPLIARTCDYVYCLAAGSLLTEGKPSEVQHHPDVIAEFLGRTAERDVAVLSDRAAPEGAPPLLEVTDVTAGYGDLQVLHGVSLDIREGEIVAVMGSNGAGKTTTLRTIVGLLRAGTGSITFAGEDVTATSPEAGVRRGIALCPEGRGMLSGLTVRQNLELGAHVVADRDLVEERLRYAFEVYPILAERQDQLAGTLSGGEQQMLAIMRATMSGPRLLLIDEASLGLSPVKAQETFKLIRRLNERDGTAVLLVEQNVHALDLADRAFVLEKGRVVHQAAGGELSELKGRLRDVYLGSAR